MWRVGRITGIERGLPPDFTFDMVPAVFFAVLILATAMGPSGAIKLYDNRICRFLGDTSYGVYLWHMVLIQIVFRHGGLPHPPDGRSFVIYCAWVVPGALLLGALSFYLVERPISLWARNVWLDWRGERTRDRTLSSS
jgi:peptidoglycan/LPS O-acetylase OafA/YrhL